MTVLPLNSACLCTCSEFLKFVLEFAAQCKDSRRATFSHHWHTLCWPILMAAFSRNKFPVPASGDQISSLCRGAPWERSTWFGDILSRDLIFVRASFMFFYLMSPSSLSLPKCARVRAHTLTKTLVFCHLRVFRHFSICGLILSFQESLKDDRIGIVPLERWEN